MAFRLFCWTTTVTSVLWLTLILHGIHAITEHSENTRLLYQLENGQSEALQPLLSLLAAEEPSLAAAQTRHRRYVPDPQPLDEYLQRGGLLASPNLPLSRQTKDTKFKENRPEFRLSSESHPGIPDNTAASAASAPLPAPTLLNTAVTPSPPPAHASTPVNKTVIVSAEFASGTPPTQQTPPKLSYDDDEDLAVNQFTDELVNKTMKQNQLYNKTEDHHQYYNSSFMVDPAIGQAHWVDMTKRDDVKINHMLSKSHRRAATVKLSFDFPFYGHLVRNVTIATGGFLYTGEYVHSWLAATQYVAPLMANFDTSIRNDSYIKYVDNGTAFTVQWEKVVLQDKPDSGEFTFQATLHKNGDIMFVYQSVPVIIEAIMDDLHPVKVGLSDAYIVDKTIFFVRRKTIYEYHRVNFNKDDIKNWTVIYLNALPTCTEKKDCSSCIAINNFDCRWCQTVSRCSSGFDRKRQEWLSQDCPRIAISTEQQCEQWQIPHEEEQHPQASNVVSPHPDDMGEVRSGGSSYLGAAFIVLLVVGVAVWGLYAYSNPHTYSGQILIRYRPSQWSWRRGEARYTAATIHM